MFGQKRRRQPSSSFDHHYHTGNDRLHHAGTSGQYIHNTQSADMHLYAWNENDGRAYERLNNNNNNNTGAATAARAATSAMAMYDDRRGDCSNYLLRDHRNSERNEGREEIYNLAGPLGTINVDIEGGHNSNDDGSIDEDAVDHFDMDDKNDNVSRDEVIRRLEEFFIQSFINPLCFPLESNNPGCALTGSLQSPKVPRIMNNLNLSADPVTHGDREIHAASSEQRLRKTEGYENARDAFRGTPNYVAGERRIDTNNKRQSAASAPKDKRKTKWSFNHQIQCRTMTSMFLVASFCHELLLSNRTTTTREVYYHYVTHFRSQRECNTAIWNVAEVLHVSRTELGLVASPKGWFCGCIDVYNSNGNLILNGRELDVSGVPITSTYLAKPHARQPSSAPSIDVPNRLPPTIRSTDARAILVIEKEGVYRRLSEDKFFLKYYPCILVTGKGYPDIATRKFVQQLQKVLQIPALGLCDCNPYGVSVLHSYQYGDRPEKKDLSRRRRMPTQQASFDEEEDYQKERICNISDARKSDRRRKVGLELYWLGLLPSMVDDLKLPPSVFQKLSSLDKKRLDAILEQDHPFHQQGFDPRRRRRELTKMSKYKVELEALNWLGIDFMSKFVHHLLTDQTFL